MALTNKSGRQRSFRFTAAVEWCLWNAVDDSTNFQRNLNIGEVEVEGSVIYHKTEYRERRDHYAYYGVNAPLSGFDPAKPGIWCLYWVTAKIPGSRNSSPPVSSARMPPIG